MNIELLDSFLSIYKYGTLSAAAQSLFLSQSTLSYRLQLLEEELGTQLFHRQKGKNESSLTTEGLYFLPLAREMRRIFNQMKNIHDNVSGKRIYVTGTNSIVTTILGRFFHFLAEKTQDEFSIYSATKHTDEVYTSIMENHADVGITIKERYHPSIISEQSLEIPLYLIQSSDIRQEIMHPVYPLQIQNYLDIPWGESSRQWIDRHFSSGLPRFSTDSALHAFFLLKGQQWFFAPKAFFDLVPDQIPFSYYKLEDYPLYKIYLIYKNRPQEEFQYIQRFLNHLRTFLRIQQQIWQ
ncbi:MAG: LysR family transcriptional regulator [Peptoniphilaceae bacterium]|nr:LysR family transcriptional regulator [Peptoniphilaceae bacterium]MDD7434168.1 LysR family transcriptional regulator [Peptoniphilaceae bacterium]MDY3075264.1 LysR family transcriptional regulator [Peptoniphilaceae bacterium]